MVCYCLPQPEPRSLDSASNTVPQGVPRGGEVGFTPVFLLQVLNWMSINLLCGQTIHRLNSLTKSENTHVEL